MGRRLLSLPLFWRVFGINAAILVLATAALIFAPVTVSVPVAETEMAVLLIGLLLLLGLDYALLRPAFRPFNELVDRMRRHDPLSPGERRRVARELHDEVGQTLTAVMLQVEAMAAKVPDDLREELDELRETARDGVEDIRRIVRQLRPEALE